MNNKLAAAGEVIATLRELFPHLFAELSKEEDAALHEIIGDSLAQGIQFFLDKDAAKENLKENLNTIEFMVISRAAAESQENLKRIFKTAGILIPVIIGAAAKIASGGGEATSA